jgi:GNAT superfamily N-acetyltransferase
VSLADELQASLGHRKVTIPDEAVGERLAGELNELGWRFSRLVTMAYRGTRERDPERASNARQVTTDEVREARLEALSDGTRDGDAGRQIVAYTEAMAAAAPSRLFAADAGDGSIGAFCELFQRDGTGQIDEVTTIKRYRRHGLGHAVVEAALQASLADRDGLTFLVADDGDWPKEWYGRLGFEPIGRRFELLRT